MIDDNAQLSLGGYHLFHCQILTKDDAGHYTFTNQRL